MWVLKMVGRRRAGNLRHRRLRRACPYSHTCDSRQARLPTKDQNGTASGPFFLDGKKRIAPGPSPSPEQGCTAPGDAFCIPPGAPHSHSAPAALPNSDRQVHQLVGRAVDGKVQVPCCLLERRQKAGTGVWTLVHPKHRAIDRSSLETASVRHIGFRRHTAEIREPIRQGGVDQKAARTPLTAVPLGEGPLAGDVVDERQPARGETTDQRNQRQDLRQDFQPISSTYINAFLAAKVSRKAAGAVPQS